ncbi:uncharacterized protein LOC108211050 [Daucus carota subsp. sativus]|uniref:uncharacterized protein LOC108211050 n=1 Tax=Daucus carota subsp. sativus TaxID=79200 RepID=UPI0030829E91
MSSSTLAVALKNLGSSHMTKKKSGLVAGSRSSAREMGSESSIPRVNPGTVAIIDVEMGGPEPAKKVDKKRKKPEKKHVSKGSTSGCGKSIMEELDLDDEEDGLRVGDHSMKEVVKIMSEMPSDSDWTEMGESGTVGMYRKAAAVWGQMGIAIAGMVALSSNQLREEKAASDDKDVRITTLDTDLKLAKSSVDDLGEKLKAAETRVSEFETEIESLKRQLAERKEPAVVISEFKESKEYDCALADAGAAEILRCWTVAERHIKSDPEASFDSFCGLYVQAKGDLEKGLGEPEAYDGPTPSFLPKELDRDVGLDHFVVQD